MKSRHLCALVLLLSCLFTVAPAQTATDVSKLSARPTVDWARDGVIYEIYPRVFSPRGDFNGVTARLTNLKKLGVDIPAHADQSDRSEGEEGKASAALMQSAIITALIQLMEQKEDLKHLMQRLMREE